MDDTFFHESREKTVKNDAKQFSTRFIYYAQNEAFPFQVGKKTFKKLTLNEEIWYR